jgi:putative heme-binding domain-containing protein
MAHFSSKMLSLALILAGTLFNPFTSMSSSAWGQGLSLQPGDHIAYIGNTTADRMQHHAWLETYLHALHPDHQLTFRNLGFSGDEVNNRPRSANFGTPDQWLTKVAADTVFCFFGYNEALRGEAGLQAFKNDLAGMLDGMAAQKYNGKSAPKVVVFSPIAHENLNSRHLPDGSANNANLELYTNAMREVCSEKGVPFVDLFDLSQQLYAVADQPLTMNGVHLLDHGNRALARAVLPQLVPGAQAPADAEIEKLREAVLEKNYYWFSRYRVVDGYNVFGGRSTLAWNGQSNADVMRREMEIFDVMTGNRDAVVWAAANGKAMEADDTNIPELLAVQTNKPGPLPEGKWPYMGAEAAISQMQIAEGMEVNVFASEEEFPRLINPVQISVDTDSRLWAAVWPSYPHWNPTQERRDAILIFPDEDQDGKADECIVFADELNSVTGFEFWGGGVLVAAPPEIWFLKDTDGDDRADLKIRMLQGVSSADTHHSANAMVVGADGWLYWSRGIFNVANFETPTTTFRSGSSGVHRFNPRTFEFEFHFPIGPNPHGDIFDQWGYQFATDGTTGTGSYINIGKGLGNKQWYQKRVRPVPAIGILDSSHFPPENKGNFLICNAIGFLGVLQHKVNYNGADITATEIEPIVVSSDPNFRPSDIEIGGDGALYIADWHNTLIGHMQHNMRDPNRDHEHGRIYRVTAKGRDLITPVKMKGKPVAEIVENFFAKETATRYRARLELTGRSEEDIRAQVAPFAASLDPQKVTENRDEAQALLECLWVFEEQRIPRVDLVQRLQAAAEPKVRAAALRTLGHWASMSDQWDKAAVEALLLQGARDESALVRAEAVKAAVEFESSAAAEAIFEAATRPTDPEMTTVINYAKGRINVDALVKDIIASGRELSPAAQAYMLQNASAADLLRLERTDAVYEAILSRAGIPSRFRQEAISALAKKNGRTTTSELLARITDAETRKFASLSDLATMLANESGDELKSQQKAIQSLVSTTKSSDVRQAGYTSWIRSGGDQQALQHALKTPSQFDDFLMSLSNLENRESTDTLYRAIRPMMFELPDHLKPESTNAAVSSEAPPVAFEYYDPLPAQNVAMETLDNATPKFEGRIPNFNKYVPNGKQDTFATRQTAGIVIPQAGPYTFHIASDDGSRLYLDGELLIDNDGLHGVVEKAGKVNLSKGVHELIVTYFDNGGGDGLRVSWEGPGINKQVIPPSALRPARARDLRDAAIDVIARWPGHFNDKVADFVSLSTGDRQSDVALAALASLPALRVADRINDNAAMAVLGRILVAGEAATPVEKQSNEFGQLLDLGDQLVAGISKDRDALAGQLADLRSSIPERVDSKIMELGQEVYSRESHCATCHQPHGQGMPNLYPPLDGSLWATGSEDRLIRIALDGLHGTIEVKGKTYSSPPIPPMTAFRQLLTDEEMAAVLTYVRNSWTNRAKPVTPEKVAAVRAATADNSTFWFAGSLLEQFPLEDGRVSVASADPNAWVPKLVKEWKYDDIDLEGLESPRTFETGQVFFGRLGCAQCHKLGEQGGMFGPDLSKLSAEKHDPQYILRSILEPSKDVDPKYAVKTFQLDTGELVTGLVVEDTDDELHVLTDPLNPTQPVVLAKDEIEDESAAGSSIMPEGTLNWLTHEEILDLIAYVYAKGDENHTYFKKP